MGSMNQLKRKRLTGIVHQEKLSRAQFLLIPPSSKYPLQAALKTQVKLNQASRNLSLMRYDFGGIRATVE